jgi:hypothetical protein
VLGRVERAELDLRRQRLGSRELVGELVPERLGGEVLLGELERDEVDHLVVREALALECHHLLGHGHVAEGELEPAVAPRLRDGLDEDHRLLLRLGVPVAVERVDDRPPRVEIELADLVGAAEVEVDGAGMHGRERALGLDRAEELARGRLHDRDPVG